MLPIKPVCLALALFSTASLACSGVPSAAFTISRGGKEQNISLKIAMVTDSIFRIFIYLGEVQTTAPCI